MRYSGGTGYKDTWEQLGSGDLMGNGYCDGVRADLELGRRCW